VKRRLPKLSGNGGGGGIRTLEAGFGPANTLSRRAP
jgi:hypothetical protein